MSAKDESKKKRTVISPEFRVSFPQIFEPKSFKGNPPKYSMVLLFDKKTDLTTLKKAAFAAAVEKWGPKEKWPKRFKMPFRDGDAEKGDVPGYQGKIFLTATSGGKYRPGLVDKDLQPIIDENGFYAGCYARAELMAFAYDEAGNSGVSFSLQNVQKLRDGEKFSGRKNAEDVFDAFDDGSNDESNFTEEDAPF